MRAFECKQDERYQFVQKKNSRNSYSRIKNAKMESIICAITQTRKYTFFTGKW